MSSIQNTPWKDLSNINYLLKLDFPTATFEKFPFFQSLPLKQWKYLKACKLSLAEAEGPPTVQWAKTPLQFLFLAIGILIISEFLINIRY